MKRDFLKELRERVIIADGAMGTMLMARGLSVAGVPAPALNLVRPTFIKAIHQEYLEAGAELIETNTFTATRPVLEAAQLGERTRDINIEGVKLAREAAADRAWVAGAIGPIGPRSQKMEQDEIIAAYREQALALVDGGVDVLLIETFGDIEDARSAVLAARSISRDIPLILQMAFTLTGSTTSGVTPRAMVEAFKGEPIDVIGHNCGGGERAAAAAAAKLASLTAKPVSIYSNRGLADLDEHGRPVYITSPDYFARQGEAVIELGVNLIGGCCGTTPEDIAALTAVLGKKRKPARRATKAATVVTKPEVALPPIVWQTPLTKLAGDGVRVIAEVDPPRGLNYRKDLEGAHELLAAGVHSITIADNPLGVMRMSNLAMAAILIRELNANITLHLACRDRNLLGSQSHLFGAAALGITNLLAITGDPVATQAHAESSGVFDVSSQNLMKVIRSMNEGALSPESDGSLRTKFCIGGAFNSGVKRLDAEAKRAERKVEAGASFFMTQPVFDITTANQILDLLEPLKVPVFIGVMPLLSERNAEFLHNEVPGITIPDLVRERMRGKKGKEGREEGLKLSKELLEGFAPRSRGVYLITPMGHYSMVAELARYARSLKLRK